MTNEELERANKIGRDLIAQGYVRHSIKRIDKFNETHKQKLQITPEGKIAYEHLKILIQMENQN